MTHPLGLDSAFVASTNVSTTWLRKSNVLSVPSSALPLREPASVPCRVRMGYGSYSYLTDKTQGHTNQYYIDKFRTKADLAKQSLSSKGEAMFGLTTKGKRNIPTEGVPQPLDSALPSFDPTAPEDPRVAEAEGAVYFWDDAYQNPESDTESTDEDPEDSEDPTKSFVEFRKAMSESRMASLNELDARAKYRRERLSAGLDQSYLLTMDGQLDYRYSVTEKISSTGSSTSSSVSALDFLPKEDEDTPFWQSDSNVSDPFKFKKR